MPPPHGTVAEARAYSGGSTSGSGPAGGASAGGNYGGDSSGGYTDQERGGGWSPGVQHSGMPTTPTPSIGGEDIDSTYLASDAYFEPTYEKTFVDKVVDYYKGGGLLGVIAGKLGQPENQYAGITGEDEYGHGDFVYESPNEYAQGEFDVDYESLDNEEQLVIDQKFYDSGHRTEAFRELYEGGDTSNLQDLSGPETTALEQLIPTASYAIANQTPEESQVDKWFANNPTGTGLDPNYMTTYNTAKANIAATLGMVDTSNQFGYSDTPYGGLTAQNLTTNPFNIPYMQERGLI
jgi:hypothetical protein